MVFSTGSEENHTASPKSPMMRSGEKAITYQHPRHAHALLVPHNHSSRQPQQEIRAHSSLRGFYENRFKSLQFTPLYRKIPTTGSITADFVCGFFYSKIMEMIDAVRNSDIDTSHRKRHFHPSEYFILPLLVILIFFFVY